MEKRYNDLKHEYQIREMTKYLSYKDLIKVDYTKGYKDK